jgi:adenylate cyclase
LRPRAFEVLRYLVENAGRLVTKEEFIKAIWPDVTVTDESLTHCVSEARNAIGDDRQAIIRTVPRRGYQFTAPVSKLSPDRGPETQSALAATPRGGTDSDRTLPDKPSIAVARLWAVETEA